MIMDRNAWIRIGRVSAFFGALTFVMLVSAAIINYPGYSIYDNFLSDLGIGNNSAIFFNSAAIISGILAILLSVALHKIFYQSNTCRIGSAILGVAGLLLAALGIFTEEYGIMHTIISFTFFAAVSTAMIILGAGLQKGMLMGILTPISFSFGITPFAEHLAVALIIIWSLEVI